MSAPREHEELGGLRTRLTSVPAADVAIGSDVEHAIADSVRYLGTDAALASLDADPYWPKWHSPWWHMLVLHELGEARRIPERAVTRMIARIDALPIHVFPIHPADTPADMDPDRHGTCHCALGSIHQVLTACGVEVDAVLPWIEPWFRRYQMADGGLSCDFEAYLVTDECPSSMVGTIAPFEAMLHGGPAAWTPAQRAFLERAATFLQQRQLVRGSPTRHNADERASATAWVKPCFPRLYFYDVLRGLSALVRWAEISGRPVAWDAMAPAVDHLVAAFPDGKVVRERRSFEGVTTMAPDPTGTWTRGHPATRFPLLEVTSELARPCPFLTRQWTEVRRGLLRLLDARQFTDL